MHKSLKFNILVEGQKNGVSITCKKYDISRTIYYRWMGRYKAKGIDGLDDIRKDFIPVNKTSSDIELSIFNLIRTYPYYGPRAIKYLLEEVGHNISESAVYNVMKRHQLTNKESRIRFSKKKVKAITASIPPISELSSGECWIFWITDYGQIEPIGQIYEYTFFDLVSKISCTRLYNTVSYSNFEDLLAAAAIPVARSLTFNTKYLCFFQDVQLSKGAKTIFQSKINHAVKDHGFDVTIHLLHKGNLLVQSIHLRTTYTEGCLSCLMPIINEGLSFSELKIHFQRYLRQYNLEQQVMYGDGMTSPIDYHLKTTGTKLILPLWAYIDREY